MKRNLIKTNLIISLILLFGFGVAAWLGNRTNYSNAIRSLEQVTALTADGIYYQLSKMLNKPVDIAQTMSHDTLLAKLLEDRGKYSREEEYTEIIKKYLEAYRREYKFDSVFLVSAETGRYYTFNGFDRLVSDNPEADKWYYNFIKSGKSYEVNIDNNKEIGGQQAITVYINCRVSDAAGKLAGVIGIGINVDYVRQVINNYERSYGVEVFFINHKGRIEVSSEHTGIQDVNIFERFHIRNMEKTVLDLENQDEIFGFWAEPDSPDSVYFVTRYMPAISWYVVISQNTSRIIQTMKSQLAGTLVVLAIIMAAVIFTISMLIKRFNTSIAKIIDQRHELFKKATGVLYEDILEWNIDANISVDKSTTAFLKKLGLDNPTYDEGIKIIAEKQVAPEFREVYLEKFDRKNIIKNFMAGASNLQLDVRVARDGVNYHWLRLEGQIFYSPEDNARHMFIYRKNIDSEKEKEFRANIDEMTGCFTKKATERMIGCELEKTPDGKFAFFILDIDNFKQANDRYGHAFGDLCIKSFASIIKSHFREHDILGRLGGDEFAVFIAIPSLDWVVERANALSRALNFVCSDGTSSWTVSASIGVAIYPIDGNNFFELYRRSDEALYRTKERGKNGVSFASWKKKGPARPSGDRPR